MLAGVLAPVQIFAGKNVGVIPAEARRARGKGVARTAAGGDQRCTFFHRTVDLRREEEAMPMNHFAVAGLVGNIDSDRMAFSQPQQRAGHLPVVRNRLDGSARSDFKFISCDVDGVISGRGLLGARGQRRG